MLEALRLAHADGTYSKRLAQLAKTDLLILDDLGLKPLQPQERHDFLEVIEDRHGRHATIITSQLPPETWLISDNHFSRFTTIKIPVL
ncbi:MAG: ATP-binding protein [Blastocatellia bacterium]|nr:ATP-binding protein [Blastocatellia bacterium]